MPTTQTLQLEVPDTSACPLLMTPSIHFFTVLSILSVHAVLELWVVLVVNLCMAHKTAMLSLLSLCQSWIRVWVELLIG